MQRLVPVFLFAVCVVIIGAAWQRPAPPTVLSALHEGQGVAIKDVGEKFELTLLKDARLSQIVTEVGSDYVVVRDSAEVTQRWIPVSSIKSVVLINTGR